MMSSSVNDVMKNLEMFSFKVHQILKGNALFEYYEIKTISPPKQQNKNDSQIQNIPR